MHCEYYAKRHVFQWDDEGIKGKTLLYIRGWSDHGAIKM